jgi:phage terminase large subunit-like protein
MDRFEYVRIKYQPQSIKYLFIAETPPKTNSDRFFYFENVTERDSLFIETMKILYPHLINDIDVKDIRQMKSKLLLKFKSEGFYLIDSLNEPFEQKYSTSQKIRLITLG